jgi:hypothetical protein
MALMLWHKRGGNMAEPSITQPLFLERLDPNGRSERDAEPLLIASPEGVFRRPH